jgi:hypothetical protein
MTRTPAGNPSPLPTRPVPDPTPEPLTGAEENAVVRLLDAMRPRPVTVVIGSARDALSERTALRLAARWQDQGGMILDTVTWPERAASWLRQANRFTRPRPDAWIVTGLLPGWVQMGRRLALSTDWDPARTVATACLSHQDLAAHGGPGTFDGLCGAHRDGGTWEFAGGRRVSRPRPAPERPEQPEQPEQPEVPGRRTGPGSR